MTRRKITEEAEQQADEQSDSVESDDGREQLTQRMPTNLVGDVDEFADEYGMSRNAAINFLCKQALKDQ